MVTSELHDVFNFDGLVTSHPLFVPLSNLEELRHVFDTISYGKV